MRLGIDAGNNELKIAGESGVFRMRSTLGEYRELKLRNTLEKGDIVYEYKGRKGFAGMLAEMESEFSGSMYGTSKAHEDTLIRVLLGISVYRIAPQYEIVVGQPIVQHDDEEKQRIKQMLLGNHSIIVNDIRYEILIERVEVAAEGGVAFWSHPKKGLVRILDFGSGTVNGATILDGKYVDRDSFTTDFGLNTIRSQDRDAFMRAVFIESQRRRWNKSDSIYLVGGAAESMIQSAERHFENVDLLRPKLVSDGEIKFIDPVYANAVGMYNVAKGIFK